MSNRILFGAFALGLLLLGACSSGNFKAGNSAPLSDTISLVEGAYLVESEDGRRLKISAYGESMIRMQSAQQGEAFFADDYYQMIESHQWTGALKAKQVGDNLSLSTEEVVVNININTLAASFSFKGDVKPVLAEKSPVNWQGSVIKASFVGDESEHFTGLGHGFYAREKSIDLAGQTIHRNYGKEQIEQAPLIVPFFMSSKGYGVFMNSTFTNTFKFNSDGEYSMAIDTLGFDGRMDYLFIGGKKLTTVLDNYTQLTGRPRLPQKAMFGLQLSDKGHDHNSPTPSDENWWKQKITEHREGGYPLDHVINDNRWRAAGGQRCVSKLDWDPERYPDPAAYGQWLEENGLVVTLDFNRCIGQYTEGWKASFNLPTPGKIDFKESAPDLTNDNFRAWFWQAFESKALAPEKNFPGDALWIDEFDEQGGAPKDMVLANGRSSGEMRNYWFYLIAKALVAEGWDKSTIDKRPFVWVRGMTAGAQRYATLWSGDIYPNYGEMEDTIRGMQLAGLSGFPYWGHDAGGFFDWDAGKGPDENLYKRWGLAMGAFAPIWKPHGMGASRWPLDRDESSQQSARYFSTLRYELMPYTYSAAHQAAATGVPMARAMVLDYQHQALAWEYDLQYLWGDSMLVAPQTQDQGEKRVWLPEGNWYEYDTNSLIEGGQEITVNPQIGQLPLYVKAGGIIPKRNFALSTTFIDKTRLNIDVYTGENGRFTLIEDDDVTEAYRLKGEVQTTRITFDNTKKSLTIFPAKGNYKGAPEARTYEITFVGVPNVTHAQINGEVHETKVEKDLIVVTVPARSLKEKVTIKLQ